MDMPVFDPRAYGIRAAAVLAGAGEMPLGSGGPEVAARAALTGLSPADLFAPEPVRDPMMAACCVSALWLRRGYLAESHALSQVIPSREGSYWHGAMHRREGDWSNAKYWFRKVGDHPIHAALAVDARVLTEDPRDAVARVLHDQLAWDPFAFVDMCQDAVEKGTAAGLCRTLQRREWELLFDYCWRGATLV